MNTHDGAISNVRTQGSMLDILIGGDQAQVTRLTGWLTAWGLRTDSLPSGEHPALVPATRAAAVIYASGPVDTAQLPPLMPAAVAVAPLLLIGQAPTMDLAAAAWMRVADPGPDGAALAAVLRPLLETAQTEGGGNQDFRDLVNHELRTPLTAAGTALQTLARQLERAGGPSLEMVDIALRNIRRLERTVDWACDYLTEGACEPTASGRAEFALVELLEDLDNLEPPLPLTWASGVGDWELLVELDRDSWRRLLRQMLRAIALLAPQQPVHLDVSLLGEVDAEAEASGLLLVFHLPLQGVAKGNQGALAAADEDLPEQLRRLLAFTVSPVLAHRLDLRLDVLRLADRLRLRVMMPLSTAQRPCCLA
jgi:signal transduction histidine kinase